MKRLAVLFALAFIKCAFALEYVVYDLDTQLATAVDNPVLTAYRGSQMLFVKLPDETAYIGVFELTQAQWAKLNGKTSTNETAYYTSTQSATGFNISLPKNLSFQTQAQWAAVCDKSEEDVRNLSMSSVQKVYNLATVLGTITPENWSTVATNSFGVVDTWGNVAEYCQEGTFAGDCASTSYKSVQQFRTASATAEVKYAGYRLVYTPPAPPVEPTYTVTINGQILETTYHVGDTVTFTPPVLEKGQRFTGVISSPVLEPVIELGATSFTMPEANVELTYAIEKFVYVTLEGGTVSTKTPALGEMITLNALTTYANVWTVGSEIFEGSSYTIPLDVEAGTTLAFKAKRQPRLLVLGGTASIVQGNETQALGNGYYQKDTRVKLSANSIEGYTFAGWSPTLEENPVTLTDYDTTVSYTATYALSGETPTVDTYKTLGSNTQREIPFGYLANTAQTVTIENIQYTYYPLSKTTLEAQPYVVFNLDSVDRTYQYATTLPTTATTTSLVLRRIYEKDDYLGVYESTIAHYENLTKDLTDKECSTTTSGSFDVTTTSTGIAPIAKAMIAALNKKYALTTAEIPSVNDYIAATNNVSQTSIARNKIWKGGTTTYKDVTYNGMDPAGFYNILGNYAEYCKDGLGYGGSAQELDAQCALYRDDQYSNYTPLMLGARFTIRPVIRIETPVVYTIEGCEVTFQIKAGTSLDLGEPTKPGYAFDTWQKKIGDTTSACTMPITLTAEDSGAVFTPTFIETHIEASYEHCSGPTTLYPGQRVSLYFEDGYTGPVMLDQSESLVQVAEDGTTLTVNNGATSGKVTVKAVRIGNGYRFGIQ